MKRAVLFGLVLILLSGCAAAAREPDELTLVQLLGVDGGDLIELVAVSGSPDEVARYDCRGGDFLQAREQIRWVGQGTELSLTGVSHLVIGADVDLKAVLLAVMEDPDLGASASVWVATDGAADLLGCCGDPVSDLKLLMLSGSTPPTVARALAAIATDGAVVLPCLSEMSGRIEERGSVVWAVE